MDTKRFDISSVYREEAEKIFAAHERAKTIHAAGNIKAAGNQVEAAVRDAIASRIAIRCQVTQGHILDYVGRSSPQLDVILSERLSLRPLFQAADGTEFVPFESVYAIGEIKSTYYRSEKDIEKFSETIALVRSQLTRQATERNPLLGFMFFVDSNGFELTDVEEFYRGAALASLPNMICFLDKGILLYARFLKTGSDTPLPVEYYVSPATDTTNPAEYHWALIELGDASSSAGANLAFFEIALAQHVLSSHLRMPNFSAYLGTYFRPRAWGIAE